VGSYLVLRGMKVQGRFGRMKTRGRGVGGDWAGGERACEGVGGFYCRGGGR